MAGGTLPHRKLAGGPSKLAFSIWKFGAQVFSKFPINCQICTLNYLLPILSKHHPMVVRHGGTMVLVVGLSKGGHTRMQ